VSTVEPRVAGGYDLLADAVADLGITFAAGLPDDWVAPLINRLDERDGFTFVRVSREPEAVAMATGAFFGGVKSAAIMGATGFLACASELTTLNLKHQVPLFMIVSERGTIEDAQVFHELQGRVAKPFTEALGIPSLVVETPADLERLPAAFNHSRLQKRPYVVWLSRRYVEAAKRG
jgi:sulfopyruvate decarboxylase subunit alpha